MPDKVLIIGLDGADWRILQPYLDNGLMPNLLHLKETGISGPLRSTIPTNSNVAWSTFITGRNPGKHAVFDFMQREPNDPTRMIGVDSRSLRSETLFNVLARHERQVGAINVPVTFPPFPINGFMLGGMIVREGEPYTFPESLATELEEQIGGFPVNCIRWRFMMGKLEELLDEAIAVTKQRALVLEYLIDHKNWDVLIQVFVGTDRLQHPLMHVLDPEHPRYDDALAQRLSPKLRTFFQVTDNMLGRSQEQIGRDATLIVISDHGFKSVHKAVYAREILAKHGLLKVNHTRATAIRLARKLRHRLTQPSESTLAKALRINRRKAGSHKEMANLIWTQTQAYTTTTSIQGVYVNLVGREPQGIVTPGAANERLLNELQELLLGEYVPVNNSPIISSVFRAQELFNGPWVKLAPDLLFTLAPGYSSSGGAKAHLGQYDWRTGDHDLDGIFVASGPGLKSGEKIDHATLIDIAPTILYLTDVPIPEDMDGQVLDLFADQRLTRVPPTFEQDMTTALENYDYVFTPEEQRQLEDQLRNLGYL